MFKIKNISKSPVSLFYIKGGKNIRTTLTPGQEIIADSTKTSQISFFEKNGKISITDCESGLSKINNNRVITDNAIYPNKKIEIEVFFENKQQETNKEDIKIDIEKLIKLNNIDYLKIIKNNVSVIFDKKEFDINVIIPVRNRHNFSKPTYESFKQAAAKTNLNICYTMVEHSENPDHSKFCKQNKINYFWIKAEKNELFNKCLAQNIGAIFSAKSKYLLFHDIDCLVQTDFFINLLKNIKNKKAKSIQNFTGRRVLYINPDLTKKIINGHFKIDDLSIDLEEIQPPHMIGAPGGSITIERDLFFQVGGYDPELFLANSPEDSFFWEKVDLLDKMHISDNPHIELYHMYHDPTYMDNPHINEMKKILEDFKSSENKKKLEIIKLKSNLIKKFK